MIVKALTALGWVTTRFFGWALPAIVAAHWKIKLTALALFAIWIIRFHM